MGVVICHDGRVYLYSSEEYIIPGYYERTVAEYLNDGYNEDEAQIQALNELKKKFPIQFKEVTGYDV